VVGPVEPGELIALDFESLCAYELQRRVAPVVTALTETYRTLDELEK
jgi:hypothetical protein